MLKIIEVRKLLRSLMLLKLLIHSERVKIRVRVRFRVGVRVG
jgi:hypothetical protein